MREVFVLAGARERLPPPEHMVDFAISAVQGMQRRLLLGRVTDPTMTSLERRYSHQYREYANTGRPSSLGRVASVALLLPTACMRSACIWR